MTDLVEKLKRPDVNFVELNHPRFCATIWYDAQNDRMCSRGLDKHEDENGQSTMHCAAGLAPAEVAKRAAQSSQVLLFTDDDMEEISYGPLDIPDWEECVECGHAVLLKHAEHVDDGPVHETCKP